MLGFSQMGPDSGSLVVFLHAVGITSWMWHPIVANLPDTNALMVDLPGHGASNQSRWNSLTDTAEQVARIIDRHHYGQDIHLVGLSLGSYVGMTLLSQRPEAYNSALLSGIHAGDMPKTWQMKLITLLTAPIASRPFFARKTARLLCGEDVDSERFVAEAGRTRSTAFRRATNAVIDYELPRNAEEIRTRLLVAAGSREHPVIRSSLDEITRRIPEAQSIQIPDGGHGWPCEKPKLFAQILRNHMAKRKIVMTDF